MIDEFLKYIGIGSSSVVLAYVLIKYLSQKIFENYLVKQIDKHKSNLEKLNIKYQIQFSSLHAERAEIIKSIYNLLYDHKNIIHDVMNNLLDEQNPIGHLKQKLDHWSSLAITLSETFHKNKIFFSIEQVNSINRIHSEINQINKMTESFFSDNRNITQNINSIFNENIEFKNLRTSSDIILENVMVLEKELEEDFRKLLGVI
ncbi:hypothetical protein [Flavobacterium crassostreae]|uniref:Uncharacterized protein n=1 Tax=Flavobacterium crassostreae TaxID=1763534 RepID=A0A1B9E3E7_9FLAO|nr:hypothetical protein [Flavobacterium crassostreae]OCB76465.1 hypothetical protein LPBF_05870 [Flavobacterium crassostreae]